MVTDLAWPIVVLLLGAGALALAWRLAERDREGQSAAAQVAHVTADAIGHLNVRLQKVEGELSGPSAFQGELDAIKTRVSKLEIARMRGTG